VVMTAVFIVKQPDAVHVLVDGAAIGPDGRIVGIFSKTVVLPHLGAAITLRGRVQHFADAILFGLPHDLPGLRAMAESSVRTMGNAIEIYIAAFDQAFAITAAGTQEIEGFALAPHIEFAFLYGRTADEIDPVDDGVTVMEALRQNPVRFANGAVGPAAGGHVQLTTIRRNGIATSIIRRWQADRIGGFVNEVRGVVGMPEDIFANA
jgi:hypothetical protein